MRTLVLVCFWLWLIRTVLRLAWLGIGDYPRTIKWSRAEDAVDVVVTAGFAAWAAWSLWS